MKRNLNCYFTNIYVVISFRDNSFMSSLSICNWRNFLQRQNRTKAFWGRVVSSYNLSIDTNTLCFKLETWFLPQLKNAWPVRTLVTFLHNRSYYRTHTTKCLEFYRNLYEIKYKLFGLNVCCPLTVQKQFIFACSGKCVFQVSNFNKQWIYYFHFCNLGCH